MIILDITLINHNKRDEGLKTDYVQQLVYSQRELTRQPPLLYSSKSEEHSLGPSQLFSNP